MLPPGDGCPTNRPPSTCGSFLFDTGNPWTMLPAYSQLQNTTPSSRSPKLKSPSSAGSRDSPLTSHGVFQARQLGTHFVTRAPAIGHVRHIFSSDLLRAWRTAEVVLEAQVAAGSESASSRVVVPLADLRERDFGSFEGQPVRSKSGIVGKMRTPLEDAESAASMKARVDRFIEDHLHPVLVGGDPTSATEHSVVVVAHGFILNTVLRVLLSRYSPTELTRIANTAQGDQHPDFLVKWSNTAYLEIAVQQIASPRQALSVEPASLSSVSITKSGDTPLVDNIGLRVVKTNCVDHLLGLKKTGGGIGSAKFDDKQRTVDSFFKGAAKNP